MFAVDMARLCHRAGPNITEPKKLSHLMRGVKEEVFAGLVRNSPTTVDEFIREATDIEQALQQRNQQYDQHAGVASAVATVLAVTDENSLRQLMRGIVREEIAVANQTATPKGFTVASVAKVARQEFRRTFAPPEQGPNHASS